MNSRATASARRIAVDTVLRSRPHSARTPRTVDTSPETNRGARRNTSSRPRNRRRCRTTTWARAKGAIGDRRARERERVRGTSATARDERRRVGGQTRSRGRDACVWTLSMRVDPPGVRETPGTAGDYYVRGVSTRARCGASHARRPKMLSPRGFSRRTGATRRRCAAAASRWRLAL